MLWILVVLGIIQGITEFFPISSSGHLVVFYNIFKINQSTILLSIFFHIATLLSVCIVYRKTLLQLIKKPFCKTNIMLVISTAITVVMVLVFEKYIVSGFNGSFIIYSFLFTAFILIIAEYLSINKINLFKIKKKNRKLNKNLQEMPNDTNLHKNTLLKTQSGVFVTQNTVNNMNIKSWQAVFIGIMQGVATIPGISRSGSTISAGLMCGVKKDTATDYSFLLSIPIIIASLFYQILKIGSLDNFLLFGFWEMFLAFVVCFVVGYLSLKYMLRIVKNNKMYYFSIYLFLLVLFLMLNQYLLNWF